MSDYIPRHMATGDHEPVDVTPRRLAWLTPSVRAWLYGICLAVIMLLGGYGVLNDATAPLWISLASAVLGTATALAHSPKTQ